MSQWASFARTGAPSTWPELGASDDPYMRLRVEPGAATGLRGRAMRVLGRDLELIRAGVREPV